MTTVQRWTGAETKALREAMRLSVRDFAAYLAVDRRTVNKWEARAADITLLPESQELLDTALRRASEEVQERFVDIVQRQKQTQSESPTNREVLLPVVVNGRPALVPLDASRLGMLTAGSEVLATSPENTDATAAEWEAMTPLNRRGFVRTSVGMTIWSALNPALPKSLSAFSVLSIEVKNAATTGRSDMVLLCM